LHPSTDHTVPAAGIGSVNALNFITFCPFKQIEPARINARKSKFFFIRIDIKLLNILKTNISKILSFNDLKKAADKFSFVSRF
jgi:hypothetical protein